MNFTCDEVYSHLQSVCVLIAIIQDVGADGERQPPGVDLVQREEHRLHGLNAALRHDRPAGPGVLPLVDHHEAPEDQVPLDHGLPFDRPEQPVLPGREQFLHRRPEAAGAVGVRAEVVPMVPHRPRS